MPIQTEARNADLNDLVALLSTQQELKLDAVVPATKMRSVGGVLEVDGMSLFGKTLLRPTEIMDGDIADKLGIPVKYLRKLRADRPDLYDANVNGWLHGLKAPGISENVGGHEVVYPADSRKFFIRSFKPLEGEEGIGRSMQSDRFAAIDNLDVLLATIAGINESGTTTECVSADLSERRMVVRFAAPAIAAMAPELLAGYNSPVPGWGRNLDGIRALAASEGKGYEPGKEPVVFAGFEISNSETGGGAFIVVPRILVQMCKNGLKVDVGGLRKVHLGAQLAEGIRFSADTEQKALELITAQVRDSVQTFLSVDFLKGAVADLEKTAGVPVTNAVETVELVAKTLKFTDEQKAGILDHFIRGGQLTAGGVLQAVTSYAQVVDSPDTAFDLENAAVRAMEVAAAA